ncbi:hypothetical protein V8F06_004183 [Rhypophila decipiens]
MQFRQEKQQSASTILVELGPRSAFQGPVKEAVKQSNRKTRRDAVEALTISNHSLALEASREMGTPQFPPGKHHPRYWHQYESATLHRAVFQKQHLRVAGPMTPTTFSRAGAPSSAYTTRLVGTTTRSNQTLRSLWKIIYHGEGNSLPTGAFAQRQLRPVEAPGNVSQQGASYREARNQDDGHFATIKRGDKEVNGLEYTKVPSGVSSVTSKPRKKERVPQSAKTIVDAKVHRVVDNERLASNPKNLALCYGPASQSVKQLAAAGFVT